MPKPDEPPSLDALAQGLSRFHASNRAQPSASSQGMGTAMQCGLELVSGVAAGCGVGWALDHWLGTSPVLLILCFFLGAGGGFLSLYRTVVQQQKTGGFTADAESNDTEGNDRRGA